MDTIEPEVRFIAHALGGGNCFLTGAGGTGKTYTLRKLVQSDKLDMDLTAPTGIAAINVGGKTIHRFAGIMLGPDRTKTDQQFYDELLAHPYKPQKRAYGRILRCECLVIDEVSMLPGRTLDFLNFLFKKVRGDDRPFGGCQVITTGDFLQLPPVRKGAEPYDWAFNSKAWKEGNFKIFLLEKIRRQADADFIRALCEMRVGKISMESARLLASRVVSNPDPAITRLFTHNSMVDKWNHIMLEDLPSEERTFKAELEIGEGTESELEYLCKNVLAPEELKLKVGARVMFLINKYEYDEGSKESYTLFVNGETGIVTGFEGDFIAVKNKEGHTIHVGRNTWWSDPMKNKGASYTQFPLRLAYAATIHKTQGMTLDNGYVDIRAAREPGQAYVALSRMRTLGGIHLKEWPKILFTSNVAVSFYEQGIGSGISGANAGGVPKEAPKQSPVVTGPRIIRPVTIRDVYPHDDPDNIDEPF